MKRHALLAGLALAATTLAGAPAGAGPSVVLHHFHPNAAMPSGLIQAADGDFYGTSGQGGEDGAGSVFKMDAAGAVTTLHSFAGFDGVRPQTALVQASDGDLYGTTTFGGAAGFGTVFKIATSGTLTTLHSFKGTDGASPHFDRWTQASDGNLYGTTMQGGARNLGTVFKVDPSGTVTTLHSFAGGDGSFPGAGLIEATDGALYGTTALGGASGRGTVFRMAPSGAITTLHSFTGANGSYPENELVEGSDGALYGTTPSGGTLNQALNRGTAFKITPAGAFTLLHSFAIVDGASPQAGLIVGSDGSFYGTTNQGGKDGAGTVFKMDPAGNVRTLHTFTRTDGADLQNSLIEASDGSFYGTTNQGGAHNDGTLFRMDSLGTVTTLHAFTGEDGFIARGGVIQGSDGYFYGTTNVGGAHGLGSVYKMDATGTITTLHSFSGSDGVFPNACRLVEGDDGNFYGTTSAGGGLLGGGYGTVFKMTPEGELTKLHSFALVDGASPSAGLTKGSDGSFYGLTFDGAPNGAGTVYKITPAGEFTSLHSFNVADGRFPFGTVIEASDGNFYGTTKGGGANGAGTVFKMDPSGAVTTLHSFSGGDGSQPYGGLVQGDDGKLFGTTTVGGAGAGIHDGSGTVFSIAPNGDLTTLHSFSGVDGRLPFGELTKGSDGNLYGTTVSGGATYNAATYTWAYGTVFKITPEGALSTLHSFSGVDGTSPYGGPIEASDGAFYGTTEGGGFSYTGVAYRLPAATS